MKRELKVRDVKAHNDAIQNERVGTYCERCRNVMCICDPSCRVINTIPKAHNRSVHDDKPRTKLSKEMQDFIVWVSEQRTFMYNHETDKWVSIEYTPKSTLQLLIHFQKNVYKNK